MILALQEGRCAIQLLQRIRRKPGNQLELMVAWQRAVFSLDVDEFLKQSKGVAQSLSVLLVAKQGVHHGLRDADEGEIGRASCRERVESSGVAGSVKKRRGHR